MNQADPHFSWDDNSAHDAKRRGAQSVNNLSLLVLLGLCFFVVLALLLYQPLQNKSRLETQLNQSQAKLDKLTQEKQYKNLVLEEFKGSEEFAETVARDVNNLALPGETVIRIKREREQTPKQDLQP